MQAWAKQEQFTKAPKVSGGFGEFMLKKMGWSEGEGLGKERNGDVDPLQLDIKMDKRGLVAAEEAMVTFTFCITSCPEMTFSLYLSKILS